jgi:hypothetical protein
MNGFMFYDELDQAQRLEWAKKDKERKEKQTKVASFSLSFFRICSSFKFAIYLI